MKKYKKIIIYSLLTLVLLISVIGIKYCLNHFMKLENVLDCNNYSCKTATYNGKEINYMFLDTYENYLNYKNKYNKTYPNFSENIKELDKDFFKENKLVVFGKVNCGIGNIEYENNLAVINYNETSCMYQYGEINVLEVKQSTEGIKFNNFDLMLEEVLDCKKYQCQQTPSSVYDNVKVNYIFIDNYQDYQDYKSRYINIYENYNETIKEYDEAFFKENKLVVFGTVNCGIGSIEYENNLAIIDVHPTKCDYQPGYIMEITQGIDKIEFRNLDSVLEDVLDCDNYSCQKTNYKEKEIDYMFLDTYENYLNYKNKYNKTYPNFSENIKEHDKNFFKENKLVVFKALNCGINNVEYENNEAIISYHETDCMYQHGEIDVLEVKQNIESIRFYNLDLIEISDCNNYDC